MKASDEAFDRELQDLAESLRGVKAPLRLESRLAEQVAARTPKWSKRNWYLMAASVLVSITGALLFWPDEPVPPSFEAQQIASGYVVLKQQIPVRTFSLHAGPSLRMVHASVVKDHSGLTRAIYVHRPTTSKISNNRRPL